MWASRCVGGVKIPCVVFYIVAVLLIFAYGYFIRRSGCPDVLERPVSESPSVQNLDGWAATHFFFWSFLGFWYPGNYVQALGVSLAWEGFEDVLGRNEVVVGGRRVQLVGSTDADTCAVDEGAAGGGEAENFWYGRYTTDTAYNLMGYILGSALAKRFWPEDSCRCKGCAAP